MKRLLLLAALIASSFAFTACETHVDGRRPAYYSDRPYHNRSQVVVHRGYDDGYYSPGYRRSSYYGGSPYSGGNYSRSYDGGSRYSRSSSRTNYIVNAPRKRTKVVVNRNRDDDDDNDRRVIRRRY